MQKALKEEQEREQQRIALALELAANENRAAEEVTFAEHSDLFVLRPRTQAKAADAVKYSGGVVDARSVEDAVAGLSVGGPTEDKYTSSPCSFARVNAVCGLDILKSA